MSCAAVLSFFLHGSQGKRGEKIPRLIVTPCVNSRWGSSTTNRAAASYAEQCCSLVTLLHLPSHAVWVHVNNRKKSSGLVLLATTTDWNNIICNVSHFLRRRYCINISNGALFVWQNMLYVINHLYIALTVKHNCTVSEVCTAQYISSFNCFSILLFCTFLPSGSRVNHVIIYHLYLELFPLLLQCIVSLSSLLQQETLFRLEPV